MTKADRKKSFTLLETIVALYVLMTGLVGALTLANNSLALVSTLKNQIVASNLAQEGLELVRNARDSSYIQAKTPGCIAPTCNPNSTTNWGTLLNCVSSNGCRIHWNQLSDLQNVNLQFLPCGSGTTCDMISLHNTERMYGYGNSSAWTPTGFDRVIFMNFEGPTSRDVRVRSIVKWNDRLGGQRWVVLETHLAPHLN